MPAVGNRAARGLVVLGVVGALLLLAAVLVLTGRDGTSPLGSARSLADDPSRFETGQEAAETFARIAQHLNRAIEECVARGPGTPRCEALSAASGYTQVLASVVLTCTAPGRHEARTRTAAYLGEVEEVGAGRSAPPDPPPLPHC